MIFYRKEIKGKKSKKESITFDLFQNYLDTDVAISKQDIKNVETVYNFDVYNGELCTSYGFKKLQMPLSTDNLQEEEELEFAGQEIKAIWSFKWHDVSQVKVDKFYIVYFNEQNQICFANLFNKRPIPLTNDTTFTETPVGCITRYNDADAMVFSSMDDGMFLLTGYLATMFPKAPKVVSICSLYGKCFAVSAVDRCYLYYSDNTNVVEWIYFLNGEGIFSFNGSSVKKYDLNCEKFLQKIDKSSANAICYEGKYFLACRYDYNDGKKIGCEKEEGYKNNVLLIIDIQNKKMNIIRGYDIKQLCVLNNPYKSKVVACFNGEKKNLVGQLTQDGKFFDEHTEKLWSSGLVDLKYPEKLKKLNFMTIKSTCDCQILIESDKEQKVYQIEGKNAIQRIKLNVVGKEIKISFLTNQDNCKISNVKIGYSII